MTNWAWEMAQMRAYASLADRDWSSSILPCTVAALGDAALTLVIFGVALALTKVLRLPLTVVSALQTVPTAVLLEKLGLARGSWAYSEDMPIVPLLRVGLLPLLQLTLLVPASIVAAQWWSRRETNRPGRGAC